MHKLTPPLDGPVLSQEVLRTLLDLTRFARQAVAHGTVEENAQALLHYLLTCCRASRGALLVRSDPPQACHPFQSLALAQMHEEEAHALLASGLASPGERVDASEGHRWLLASIPLFQAGTMLSLPLAWEAEHALATRVCFPESAALVLGWSTEAGQNPQQDLAYRGALLAQVGDALSVILMHLLLAASLVPRNLRVAAPHILSWPSDAGMDKGKAAACVPDAKAGTRARKIVTNL